jgi:hypothetical protein
MLLTLMLSACLLQALQPLLERLQLKLSGSRRRDAAELGPVVQRVYVVSA